MRAHADAFRWYARLASYSSRKLRRNATPRDLLRLRDHRYRFSAIGTAQTANRQPRDSGSLLVARRIAVNNDAFTSHCLHLAPQEGGPGVADDILPLPCRPSHQQRRYLAAVLPPSCGCLTGPRGGCGGVTGDSSMTHQGAMSP